MEKFKLLADTKYGSAFFYFFMGTLIIIAIIGITFAVKNNNKISTPEQNKDIGSKQVSSIESKLNGIGQTKKGIDTVVTSIPSNQKLLINTNVLSTRLVGYVGPYNSGVFNEDDAVRLALSTGARCLILEIDYLESNPTEPLLIYRDGAGNKLSNNEGNLKKVADSIAARAFTSSNDSVPPNVASDPLFVVLYFRRTPSSSNPLSTTELTKNQLIFYTNVAKYLSPIKPLILGQTDHGDFRKQALQNELFFKPISTFKKRIIVMTNADLSIFNLKTLVGANRLLAQTNNLLSMTHVRLFSRESPSGLGITSGPTSTEKPAAVITTPSYWLNTPSDKLKDAIEQTKSAWTIVMKPIANEKNAISKSDINTLLKKYGVHSVPMCIIDDAPITTNWLGKDAPYEKTVWNVKSLSLRYIPPEPIVVRKASPATNTKGGKVNVPRI